MPWLKAIYVLLLLNDHLNILQIITCVVNLEKNALKRIVMMSGVWIQPIQKVLDSVDQRSNLSFLNVWNFNFNF